MSDQSQEKQQSESVSAKQMKAEFEKLSRIPTWEELDRAQREAARQVLEEFNKTSD